MEVGAAGGSAHPSTHLECFWVQGGLASPRSDVLEPLVTPLGLGCAKRSRFAGKPPSSWAEPGAKQDFGSTPAAAISYAKRITSSAGLIKCLKHNSSIKGGSYRLAFSHQVTPKIPIQLN